MTNINHRPHHRSLAYFITPHGYGHAARAAAVMTTLRVHDPALQFEIFSQIPQAFFEDSLQGQVGYHPLLTDIGLVQQSSLQEDLPETVRRLNNFFPFEATFVRRLARQVLDLGCELLLCDIAPLGIAVAQAANLPSILIENFTWDWIYEGYVATTPSMSAHIPYLRGLFQRADHHIQTQPVCDPQPVDLTTHPVSRKPRTPAAHIRQQLEAPTEAKVVMVTMGGGTWDFSITEQLAQHKGLFFIMANNNPTLERGENWLILPRQSNFFHPDLVNACDAVIGKVGYSTLAEVYQAGVPFGYIARRHFRESPSLTAYIATKMQGFAFTETELQAGSWLERLPELLALPRLAPRQTNGADEIATFVLERLAA